MRQINKAMFLGSKYFGLEIFKSLYSASADIEWCVVCPHDSEDVRSCLDDFSRFTKDKKLSFVELKSPDLLSLEVAQRKPDIVFVCGYYRILPSNLLGAVKVGVWGIHNSLLPAYRGGSPLVWQIINGENIIGSSLFKFGKEMDNGPILYQVSFKNREDMTIAKAENALCKLWREALPDIWNAFRRGEVDPVEQNHKNATYCAQRQDDDGLIDWSLNAKAIDRFIRGQARPYPMAYFNYNGNKARIISHHIDERTVFGTHGQVFEVRDECVTVCCGEGTAISIVKVFVDEKEIPASELLKSIKIRL